MDLKEYYRSSAVQARMAEFMGGPTIDQATCYFIARCRDYDHPEFAAAQPMQLSLFLENDMEICRSLWDRHSLILHLDVEYVNFDFPAEPYLDPVRAYDIQQPVYEAIIDFLRRFDIHPLHLLSGRGHHFVWRISRYCSAFDNMAHITRLPRQLETMYAAPLEPLGESIDPTLAAAFEGLGLVMEYVARSVQHESAVYCSLPVQFVDLSTAPQQRGRETVAVDITEYGDPLYTRVIRVPFSAYLKPWRNGTLHHEIPPMFAVPSAGGDRKEDIAALRDAGRAAELAQRTHTEIPDASNQMEALIEAYIRSDLARFHAWFYLPDHEPKSRWPETYDRFRPDQPEIRHILDHPNDLLLKPDCIRKVVVALCRQGWHPRHIAGLIRSKYERDYGWLSKWFNYDAGKRADFYTRLFAGSIALGGDVGPDFENVAMARQVLSFSV
ncbi:MAG: hypothetical protein IH624_00185 [Phycisphaerae bacterium]|nr:hypothetical protein [Phycisphaerae bacterium]